VEWWEKAATMSHADRNLLFGILAVQMDFVARDSLIEAMHAWSLEKSKPLGQILVEQQALSLARHDLLEQLVEEHLAAHGGDAEQSLAATDGLGAFRAELERVADHKIRATLDRVPGGAAAAPNDSEATFTYFQGSPAAGSRFAILRPHARGGLGQISVALDAELNREVALKELRPERADDQDSRARFLLEAEITGRLEHPGVVPVYGLGRDAQGRPFYAMRFVKGDSFKEAIDRFHAAEDGDDRDPRRWNLDLRQLLNRFVAVCNVMAYAHSRGVIHRDIKPANILLGPYGETLVVDWGLAKVVGRGEAAAPGVVEFTLQPASGSGSSETLPGTALGTPAYMSPEQAEGRLEQVGPLSDVYSLGATLYCLLTGKPPIGETEVGEALRRVRRGEFPPPRAVRPGIPPGLEAIGLKAMALEPDERYPSTRALADEIEHWLADEPVSVYREPITVRLTRWGRRHRTLATGIGVLLVTAVVGLVIATALIRGEQLRTEGERLRAELSLTETKRLRKIADDRALDATRTAQELTRKNYIGNVNLALSECLGNKVSRALELLDGCPKDLRGWEWDYAWRQCHLDLGTFRQSGQALNGVAFSPDGTRVAAVSGAFARQELALKGDLVVRDVATGQEIFSHRNVASGFRGVAFSPDGRWIATGNALDVVIWNAATGEEAFRMPDPGRRDDPVLSLAFSTDSSRIIAGYGAFNRPKIVGHAKLWDLTSRRLIKRVPANGGAVYSVAFSPDGREEVAVASEGFLELWDLRATPRQIRAIRCHGGTIWAVAFSPDGQYLASCGADRALRLWDRATGHEIRAFFGHEGFVRGLAISPDSQWLLSASEDGSLKLWEIASGRSLADFHGHQSITTCVAYSPDGRLVASGGLDHAVKLWFAAQRAPLTFTGHDGAVCGLEFLPKSQRLVSGAGYYSTRDRLQLWDTTTGVPLEPSFERCSEVHAVALHRDGRRLATAHLDQIAGAGTVRVWDLDTGRSVWEQKAQAAWVTDVAFSPDGRSLASAGQDERKLGGAVTLWDAETGRKIRDFAKQTAGVTGVAFSPDNRLLASGWGDGIVRIWDAKDPAREAREFPRHSGQVKRVLFLPDGRLASAGGSRSAESSTTAGLGEVKIWDLSSGRVLNLRGHTALVEGLACSPDGRRLATGSDDQTIKLWDTTTGEELFTLRGHTGGVICVAFSPDGQRIASGSWDRTLRVWDTCAPASHDLFRRGVEPRVRSSELPADPFAR
jgi:WD40 repeat protein/tRNA A-37 threonylcarbamoyl transferase component Bud32